MLEGILGGREPGLKTNNQPILELKAQGYGKDFAKLFANVKEGIKEENKTKIYKDNNLKEKNIREYEKSKTTRKKMKNKLEGSHEEKDKLKNKIESLLLNIQKLYDLFLGEKLNMELKSVSEVNKLFSLLKEIDLDLVLENLEDLALDYGFNLELLELDTRLDQVLELLTMEKIDKAEVKDLSLELGKDLKNLIKTSLETKTNNKGEARKVIDEGIREIGDFREVDPTDLEENTGLKEKDKNIKVKLEKINGENSETVEEENLVEEVEGDFIENKILNSLTINAKGDVETFNPINEVMEEVRPQDIIEQIIEKVDVNVKELKQEIKISLKPEILGELVLKIEMKKGSLLTKIMVDNYKTKELIEANLYQLKQEMQENGLEIRTFEVFVGTNEDFRREKGRNYYPEKNNKKFKFKNKDLNKVENINTYDNNVLQPSNGIYHEGELNLFA